MPTTQQLTAYARVLLQKGLNLQQGQTLVINAPVESHDFVALLTKEAYTAGAAQVVCNWRSDAMARLRYEHEDQQYFRELDTFPYASKPDPEQHQRHGNNHMQHI